MRKIEENFYRMLHPKVIFLLTSVGNDGRDNVMTCAWATPAAEEPPMIIVCVAKEHYSAELILETGEFAVNIPTKEFERAIWICGTKSGREVDKFKEAKLNKIKAKKISAPIIEGVAGFMECKLVNTIDAGECYAFLAEVLNSEVKEELFKNNLWIPQSIPMHLGGKRIVYFS